MPGHKAELFVTNPDNEFMCPICMDVLREPRMCSAGHTFCADCVEPLIRSKGNCPTCRKALKNDDMIFNTTIKNAILRLRTRCQYCEWQCNLNDLDPHMTNCPLRDANCPHCNAIISFDQLEQHIAECDHLMITCDLCKVSVRKSKEAQHQDICPEITVECPLLALCRACNNCPGTMTRRELVIHVNNIHCVKLLCDSAAKVEQLEKEITSLEAIIEEYSPVTVANFFMDVCDEGEESGHYTGEMKNGKRYGKGTMLFTSGDVYTGEWIGNKVWGKGKYVNASGEQTEGDWVDGVPHGYAICIMKPDGEMESSYNHKVKYEGDMKCGMANGQGKVTFRDGAVLESQWLEDERFGGGKMKYPNGSVYHGDIRDFQIGADGTRILLEGHTKDDTKVIHLKHGHGKMTDKCDQTVYEGEWEKDEKHGQGICTWRDGTTYTGEWKNDKMNGAGRVVWANADTFFGHIDQNGHAHGQLKNSAGTYQGTLDFTIKNGFLVVVKSGIGCTKYIDGSMYEGAYLNDLPHGKGKYGYADGSVYEGDWKEGKRDGIGILTKTVYKYEGGWQNDILHGKGTETDRTGSVFTGEWVKGVKKGLGSLCLRTHTLTGIWDGEVIGKGTIVYANGDVYEGDIRNKRRHGMGKLTYANPQGNLAPQEYVGQWVDDCQEGKGRMLYRGNLTSSYYEGTWKKNKRDGHGKLDFGDGVYEGGWRCDKRHGSGTMQYRGGVFKADWLLGRDPLKNQYGTDRYEGEWRDDHHWGVGSMTFANGSQYVGDWRNSRPHGKGKLTHNGKISQGEWEEGVVKNGWLPKLY